MCEDCTFAPSGCLMLTRFVLIVASSDSEATTSKYLIALESNIIHSCMPSRSKFTILNSLLAAYVNHTCDIGCHPTVISERFLLLGQYVLFLDGG